MTIQQGSTVIPGAIIMVNDNIPDIIKSRLIIQLHITETITGQEFDIRLAADPDYSRNIRVLNQRLLVVRSFLDSTNRTEMDVVIYIKYGLATISQNCFGPPTATFPVKNLYWGQLCIYNTIPNRTCQDCSCSQTYYPDGYCCCNNSPYYPAKYDPNFPYENHWYNNLNYRTGIFGNEIPVNTTKCLCGQYDCSDSGCIPKLDCRLVKA